MGQAGPAQNQMKVWMLFICTGGSSCESCKNIPVDSLWKQTRNEVEKEIHLPHTTDTLLYPAGQGLHTPFLLVWVLHPHMEMGAVSAEMPHRGKEELWHSHSSLGVPTAQTCVNAGRGWASREKRRWDVECHSKGRKGWPVMGLKIS